MAYTSLWRARAGGRPLLTRRDALGLLEVNAPPGATAIELEHRPAAAEWAGLAASGASAVALLLARRKRGAALRRADRS